ncbi:MAG: TonB-dependent receptor [Bacteroidetes bacterium]|nr:TonB-dependent receptor [Bacteroidota bacterium]
MKYRFMCCIYFGFIWISFSQNVSIFDHKTQKPLEGVSLISKNPKASATTNSEGKADISEFKGSKHIKVRLVGYTTMYLKYEKIVEKNFKIGLNAFGFNLDEVVVSATRWQQSSSNVSSKIVSISSKDVKLQNPQTTADLLGISGKVFVQKSQQGGGSPMIRGFAANRLVYTVDGVRMNTAIFRGGNLQNVINLDPFAIENTEVLFGPGSVIYGSDAIGGVMSFQTLTPKLSTTKKPVFSGNAVTRFSSANTEQTGHLDVNLGWKKWAFATSFSSWDFDHLRQGSHGPEDYIKNIYPDRQNGTDVTIEQDDELLQIPSAYSQVNLMQKIRFKPNSNWNFEYGFHYSKTSTYGRYDRHNRTTNGNLRYAEWNYGPQQWLMNNLIITHGQANSFYEKVTLRLAQQSFEESRIDRNFNDNQRRTRRENVEAYSINLDFIKNIGKTHKLFYGVEYILNDVNSKGTQKNITNGIITDVADRYPQAKWNSLAVYVNDEWMLKDKLSLQVGLRYNHFGLEADFTKNLDFFPFNFSKAELNNGSLTGSLGAVYRPNPKMTIRANFGTAFRSPNVDDIGKVFDSEPGSVVLPNPNLDAEYAYNFDLGIAKVFGNRLKLDFTGFYTLLDNALVRRNFQLNGEDFIEYDGELSQIQAIQNAAEAYVFGIQFGLEAKLVDKLTLFTDLNYQIGEEELDDGSQGSARHAAPFFGISRLRYKFLNDFILELNAHYQGEQSFEDLAISERSKDEIYAKDDNGNNYAPAWYTLNLKAQYRFNNRFVLSGGIENFTDQRYRPYSSGISGPGINFVFALNFRF